MTLKVIDWTRKNKIKILKRKSDLSEVKSGRFNTRERQ